MSTYNSSIEFVDCINENFPSFSVENANNSRSDGHDHENFSFSYLKTNGINATYDSTIQFGDELKLKIDNTSDNKMKSEEESDTPTNTSGCRSQLPVSYSSVITTRDEVIPVEPRSSLILEDLETEDCDRTVLVYTTPQNCGVSIDDQDILVVDTSTNTAAIVN